MLNGLVIKIRLTHWLTTRSLTNYTAKVQCSQLRGLLPWQFCNIFVLNSEVTRNKNLIHQVVHRINARALSIRIYGVKIWNALPTFIQNSSKFPILKKRCKTYFLETASVSI